MLNTADIKPTYQQIEAKIIQFEAQLTQIKAQNEKLEANNIYLTEELDKLRRLIYGQSRERFIPANPDEQMNIFSVDEITTESKVETEKISYTRTQKPPKHTPDGRNPLPAHLPRVEKIIEPEDHDVSGLKKIGEEVTETLDYIPGKLIVNKYIRPKYALPKDEGVVIANLPSRPIEKGIAEAGLLSHILIGKFVDHLPLYRQRQQFKRLDVDIAASTINDWVMSSGCLLAPLYDVLKDCVLESDYLMADETTIPVLESIKKGKTHLGYHWVYFSPLTGLALFDYREGRSRAGPNQILENFKGFLQTDGYASYNNIMAKSLVIALACFAHARRKFFDAQKNDAEKAKWAVDKISKLYDIERKARETNITHDERFQLRQHSAPCRF